MKINWPRAHSLKFFKRKVSLFKRLSHGRNPLVKGQEPKILGNITDLGDDDLDIVFEAFDDNK
ncbi:hypothetical protein OAH46_03990 [Verrucomicrobia bacterium]|nr:hypothetical protein [Verrucomicrobiota bacterium]